MKFKLGDKVKLNSFGKEIYPAPEDDVVYIIDAILSDGRFGLAAADSKAFRDSLILVDLWEVEKYASILSVSGSRKLLK